MHESYKLLEMKKTISEMKNTLDGMNTLDNVGKKVSELKDIAMKMIQKNTKRRKTKSEQSVSYRREQFT